MGTNVPADCEENIEKSGRTLGNRLKEHFRCPSPIYQHSQATEHPIRVDCFTIIDREAHCITGTIKEAIFIHVNDPSLDRNLGKYQLPHIWDEVLQDTASLNLRWATPITPCLWVSTSPPWHMWGAHTNSVTLLSMVLPPPGGTNSPQFPPKILVLFHNTDAIYGKYV